MITNETIIKAAKAAGLDCIVKGNEPFARLLVEGRLFDPLDEDTDNAMIMDGAEISIAYHLDSVSASFYIDEHGMHSEPLSTKLDKAQARHKAVIRCAAAKWDVMSKGVE